MLKNYIKLLRVSHWVKNLFVFVPVLFAQLLFEEEYFFTVLLAFLAFSIVTSTVYIFNDILDAEADRLHPVKKFRPIACGAVSLTRGYTLMAILFAAALLLSTLFNPLFNLVLLAYLILNVFYTTVLKNIVVVDIFSIAAGFLLRVVGGGLVIEVEISRWLVLTTIFISLFLAVMKRRSELVLLDPDGGTRKVLSDYTLVFIDQISAVNAACVIISYAMYTVSQRVLAEYHTDKLVYSTIFVVFGIFRYMFLVFKRSKGENAIEILVTDAQMIVNILFYVAFIVYFIYR